MSRYTFYKRLALLFVAAVILSACAGTTPTPVSPAPNTPPPTTSTPQVITLKDGESELAITYVYNSGFIIDDGEVKIIIDALLRHGNPTERIRLMSNALPPFDNADLILVTQSHEPHFDSDIAGDHLTNNPHAILVAPPAAYSDLQDNYADFEAIQDRVVSVWSEETGGRETLTPNGIEIEAIRLARGHDEYGGSNMGFIFQIGGYKLLHTGDIWEEAVKNFQGYGLPDDGIDIAFIPYFFLEDSFWRNLVQQGTATDWIVPFHLSQLAALDGPSGPSDKLDHIASFLPEAILFYEEMQTVIIH